LNKRDARRRSYSRLAQLPAWWLIDVNGKPIASVRAENRPRAMFVLRNKLTREELERGVELVLADDQ